jgi:CheY-like chemotaxis protein
MSANSKNLPVFGGPPRRLSQARSPAGPLRLCLGAIQRPSAEDFSLLPFFGIHYHLKPEYLEKRAMTMALVLCTGVDPVLMKTRQLILENAGHTVVPASGEHEIKAVCGAQKFDVAVIGQSISSKGKARVLDLVREHCPQARILELTPEYASKALADADAWLRMPSEPEELVNAVNSLASGSPRKKRP